MHKRSLNRNGVYNDESIKTNSGSPFIGMYDGYFYGYAGTGVSGGGSGSKAGKGGKRAYQHRRNHG